MSLARGLTNPEHPLRYGHAMERVAKPLVRPYITKIAGQEKNIYSTSILMARTRSQSSLDDRRNDSLSNIVSSIRKLQNAVQRLQRIAAANRQPKDGIDGKDGAPGRDGAPGNDGAPGKDGAPGRNGADGLNGSNGENGKDGADGRNGADGRDYDHPNHNSVCDVIMTPPLRVCALAPMPSHRIRVSVSAAGRQLPIHFSLSRRECFSKLMMICCDRLKLHSSAFPPRCFAFHHNGVQLLEGSTPTDLGYGEGTPVMKVPLEIVEI